MKFLEDARECSWRSLSVVAGIGALVIAFDQLTKSWALAHFLMPHHVIWTLSLGVHFNKGAAFSFGTSLTSVLSVAAVVAAVVMLYVGRRLQSVRTMILLGIVLGGALGNVVDRVFRDHGGGVVDFIDFDWWPVFNFADVSIVGGCLGLAFFGQWSSQRHSPKRAEINQEENDGRVGDSSAAE